MTMDHPLSLTIGTMAGKSAAAHGDQFQSSQFQLLIPLLAVLVWVIEYKRRARPSTSGMGERLFRQLLPEMVGLALLSVLVAVLLVCRREASSVQDDETWRSAKKEWALLETADTLLGLQAMLRLVFLVSASFRRTSTQLSPFDGEPAAYFLLAALARVILLSLSPRDTYHLDGPLGSDLNVAVEITGFLLLLPLGCQILKKDLRRVAALILVAVMLAAVAHRNHFALADQNQSYLDVLFSLAILLEIAAGVAFHVHSVWMKGSDASDAFTGFAHFMLPFQQALPTYYLIVAFVFPFEVFPDLFKVVPELVGKGCPFQLLQAGSLLQLLMYLFAAVMYCVNFVSEKQASTFEVSVPAGDVESAGGASRTIQMSTVPIDSYDNTGAGAATTERVPLLL